MPVTPNWQGDMLSDTFWGFLFIYLFF
jgi:hypothetical protein